MRVGTLVILATAQFLTGCGTQVAWNPQDEIRSIPVGKAEMVRTVVEMKAGQLEIRGGVKSLLEARFEYSDPRWRPEVRYEEKGLRGNLAVSQGSIAFDIGRPSGARYDWDLVLNQSVPMDLVVGLGAGQSLLDLRGMNLRGLEVRLGAGQTELDLSGKWRQGFDARIRGGVGQVTVRLPRQVGVQAAAQGGIGEIRAPEFHHSGNRYTNDAAQDSPAPIRLDIRGGIGQIVLNLAD